MTGRFPTRTAKAREQLDNSKSELDQAQQKYDSGVADLNALKAQCAQAKEDPSQAKADLADAEAEVADMAKFDWSVMPRSYNGGAGEISMFSDVTNNLSISMAALFIIVGSVVLALIMSLIALRRINRFNLTDINKF